ncbi:MAG: glucosaminidase domain-containing protein [Candidatus Pristimantibacillus sp.]
MVSMTRVQFLTALTSTVIQVRREGSVIFPSVRLAQSLLETGGVIHPWYNLGGIKVGNASPNAYWNGQGIVKGTWEFVDGRSVDIKAAFRVYSSVYHYFKDQELLFAKSRYERVRSSATPELQAQMLRVCGYATDPQYENKIIAIVKQYNLKLYDGIIATESTTGVFKDTPTVPILHNGLVITVGYNLLGTVWVPARSLGEVLGATIGWTGSQVLINGKELDTKLDIQTGFVKIKDLALELNKQAVWEAKTRTVTLNG